MPVNFPIVNIAAGTAPVEGVTPGTHTITLNAPAPTGGLTVNYTLAGTATNGSDYTLAAGTNITTLTSSSFTIAAGQTSATLQVIAANDGITDPDETVQLTLANGTGYTLGYNPTTPFVATPAVPVGGFPYSVAIGDFNGDGTADIATANAGSNSDVSIRLGDGAGNFSGSTAVPVGGGSVMILMLWIFFSCQVFFFGCEMTYTYTYLFGSRSGICLPAQNQTADQQSR
jgi:hypothetical protein